MKDIGRYRTDNEPLQVVSGALYSPKVHFEAPPFAKVHQEMTRFINRFNRTTQKWPRASSATPLDRSQSPFIDGRIHQGPTTFRVLEWGPKGPVVATRDAEVG